MKKRVKSLKHLERGIKQLLSENRCSLSEQQKVFLNSSLSYLKSPKRDKETENMAKLWPAFEVLDFLIRLYAVVEFLKDLL